MRMWWWSSQELTAKARRRRKGREVNFIAVFAPFSLRHGGSFQQRFSFDLPAALWKLAVQDIFEGQSASNFSV